LPYPQFRLPGFSRELLQLMPHFNNPSRQFRALAVDLSLNLSGKTKRKFTPFQNNPGIREETLTSLGYLRYATLSLLIVLMGGYVSE
jgi:hypothetical protein